MQISISVCPASYLFLPLGNWLGDYVKLDQNPRDLFQYVSTLGAGYEGEVDLCKDLRKEQQGKEQLVWIFFFLLLRRCEIGAITLMRILIHRLPLRKSN
jgi:hypothetical protein